MHSIPYQKIKTVAVGVVLLALGLGAGGCLNSSSSKLGDGHDFGNNDRNVVVAMGDSITAGSSWTGHFANMVQKKVINRGRDGATASGGSSRINGELRRNKPGFVIIFYGANDAIQGVNPDTTEAAIRAMIGAAKANQTIPVVANVMPMAGGRRIFNGRVDRINERIRSVVSQEGVRLANVHGAIAKNPEKYLKDGLHPNDLGSQIIAATFLDAFE